MAIDSEQSSPQTCPARPWRGSLFFNILLSVGERYNISPSRSPTSSDATFEDRNEGASAQCGTYGR